MKVEVATIDDWKKIQELNNKLFVYEGDFDKTLDMKWPFSQEGEDYYRTSLVKGNYGVFVVKNEDSEIIAYAISYVKKGCYYRNIKKIVEVENIYVEEDYRKQGIGKQLFSKVEDFAKSKQAEAVSVAATAMNDKAIAFYNSIGFGAYSIELEKKI